MIAYVEQNRSEYDPRTDFLHRLLDSTAAGQIVTTGGRHQPHSRSCDCPLTAGVAGTLCRRLGLSVVVGYLVAGTMIGPYTPPFSFTGSAFTCFARGLRLPG
jgi:hypothetical protein